MSSNEEKEKMKRVPYASAITSLMYVIICTIPYIVYPMGVVRRLCTNLRKEHWAIVK